MVRYQFLSLCAHQMIIVHMILFTVMLPLVYCEPTISPTVMPTIDVITTVVGSGTATYSGDNDAATSAAINSPYGIALDLSG